MRSDWFLVDSVRYIGAAIASLDVRFERGHAGGAAPENPLDRPLRLSPDSRARWAPGHGVGQGRRVADAAK